MTIESGALETPSSASVDDRNDDVLVFPVSHGQRRLWLVNQLDPASPAYNVSLHRHFRGALDHDALERSLETVVCRHEALRTTFSVVEGEPVQVIAPPARMPLPVVDFSTLPSEERTSAVLEHASAAAKAPFDLARGPLLRASLLRLKTEEHVLLLTMHHIVSDGWSVGIFFRELAACYNAFRNGAEPALPELTTQYADYAMWQRDWLQGRTLERQIDYWRGQLDGLAVADLPADRLRPDNPTFHGASLTFEIPGDAVERLKCIGREEGATLFMMLLAGFTLLQHRYTGKTDLAVGVPVAGRSLRELEDVIGFFVNTLVLRTQLDDVTSFRDVVRRVRETALDAFSHEDVPFEKLTEELHPARGAGPTPFFQVMFALQNAPSRKQCFSGLHTRAFKVNRHAAKFDLTILWSERRGGISGRLSYNTDLFDAATIARMARHLCTLMAGAAAEPDQPIDGLSMLDGPERDRLLLAWNDTERDYPKHQRVHELFEEQALRSPDAPALVYEPTTAHAGIGVPEEARVSYGELNARANQLAHRLQEMGVRPGDVVGICMERSVDLVVAVLAVLKANAAYLPLDMAAPSERLSMMLDDAAVHVVVTRSDCRGRIHPIEDVQFLYVDEERESLARASSLNPGAYVDPSQAMYVMYTSGSTGRPKGVAVPHRAVIRLVRNTDYVHLTPDDVVAHLSNVAFDAATFELWGALLNGCRLIILDREAVLKPLAFADTLHRHGVTAVFVTTALFNVLAREAPGAFSGVRTVLFGGEACDPKWVRSVLASGPPERLVHVYGPTETTTFATWHEVRNVPEDATTVPIGGPVANARAYVLDAHMNPVPAGVHGELYIGGDGVALGYLHAPELTSERFLDDPFSAVPGARMYRTGDVVRRRSDGPIEFVGRSDNQVKIRGFRIELGEIETLLQQHPAVEACAVAACETEGQKQLAAYVVYKDGVEADDLRVHLKSRLPEHAIPAFVVRMNELPLNGNGKINRDALPVPERKDLSQSQFEAPRSAVEARLVSLWEVVLQRRPIGTQDDFFDMGGHSLLAVQLVAAMERAFDRRLPISVLFSRRTVAQMARLLVDEKADLSWQALTPIKTSGSAPPLFCIHGVAGHVFKYARLEPYLDRDQPVFALQGLGIDGAAVPYDDVEDMAGHYIAEMRSVHPRGPYLLASNCVGGLIALEIARQLADAGEDVPLLVIFDPPGPHVKGRLRERFRNLRQRRVRQYLGARLLLAAGRSVPHRLRPAYVATTYKRLLAAHRPQPYAGRITIIRAGRPDSAGFGRQWEEFARRGVEVHQIDGPHDLLQEPYVGELAACLQRCIHRATSRTVSDGGAALTSQQPIIDGVIR